MPSGRDFTGRAGPVTQVPRPLGLALLTAGLAAAAVFVAAEFAPLLTVRSSVLGAPVATVTTSTHDAWALIPLALLTVFLSLAVWRTGSRWATLALGVVGVTAILIALLGDLPDAQATGLVGNQSTRYAIAVSSPAAGFYLETLGAAVLIIVAGAGLLLSANPTRSVGSG